MNEQDYQILIDGVELLIKQLDENINIQRREDYIKNEKSLMIFVVLDALLKF